MLLSKMDELGRPAWAFAVVLGFWLLWPVGLVILAYLAWTGRLRAMNDAPGRWSNLRGGAFPWVWPGGATPSGNRAFDDYRADTLHRLEEEQREFQAYLERLRRARDKAEFDQFMAERRRSESSPPMTTDKENTSAHA